MSGWVGVSPISLEYANILLGREDERGGGPVHAAACAVAVCGREMDRLGHVIRACTSSVHFMNRKKKEGGRREGGIATRCSPVDDGGTQLVHKEEKKRKGEVGGGDSGTTRGSR